MLAPPLPGTIVNMQHGEVDMNISGISDAARASVLLSTSSVTQPSASARKAFEQAASRLDQQLQTTEAKISTLGQVKSTLAQVQSSASALAKTTSATTSPNELRAGLQKLVDNYNAARAAGTAAGPGTGQSTSNDLQRALASDSTRTDLQALGVRQQADGRLVFDSATFAAAVKDNPSGTNTAANRIGREIAQVADRTLSDNSRLNIALKNLNTQAGNLESRQTAQQAMADAAKASAEQAGLRLNSALTASGIASYQKIFSL